MGSGRASSTMYYDYTEAFGEDEDSDKARAVPSWPLTSVDAANLRARPSGVNVDPDALLRGAEASDTLRNKSDEDDTAIDLVYHGKSDAVDLAKKFLKSANPLCSAPGNDDAFAEEKHDSPKEIPKQNIKPAQSSVGRSEKNSSRDVPRGSSSSPSTFPTRRLSFTDSNRSGDDLSFSSAFISSPNLPRLSALSKDQVILWEDHMRAFTPSSFNDSKTPSLPQWIIPSMKFSHLDLAGRLEDTQSPAGVPRTDSTEIHSPVPERPLTSRSHNQKFASLISIDQGLAELKDVITTFEAAERPYTPDDFISESNRSSVYFPYRTSSRLSKSAPRTVDLFDESVQKDVVESQPPKTAEESMNTVDQISSDRSGNVSPREDLDKHGTLDELQVTKYPSHPRANSSEPLSPRRVSAESQNAKARDSVASSYIRRLSSSLSPPAHLVDNIAAHIRPRKSSVTATPTSPYPDNAAAVDDNPETSHKISRASKDGLTHTATDPPQVQPRNSSLGAVSPLSQNGTVASNLMHISSDAKLTKEISILPNAESFKAFTPPISHRRSRLPFSFAPLLSENGLEIAGIEAPIVDNYKRLEDTSGEGRPMQRRFKVKLRSTRPILSTSPPDSRPWNLDESYPWANNTSSIEMNIPPPTAPVAHRNHPSQSPSKFKVKVPRSSASPTGTVKVNKKRVAAGSSPPISASINLFSSGKNANASSGFFGSLGRKLGHGSRIRVSEDGGSSAVHSESRPPTIQLAIPSPTLNRSEVQSFFSDDSSFKRNRGSVRQRLSQFKARLPASRKNSTEDLRDPEKIFFMSMPRRSRSDGRLSEDDGEEIVGMSNVEYRVRKLVEVVKNWVQKAKNINGKYSGTKFYAGHETGNLGASV
ncbi:MAG: hypothetical protein M1827_007238 [Pycnora praestabilis]|nr:MAG: hypothetical protein M1827_007238 [Pycnora praestabilis]